MIKTICYISNIKTNTSQKELRKLSHSISKKNDELHVTGVLIIQNGHFFQIMEGEESTIENTFKKIELDKRHFGLIKLLDTTIDYRMFEDYESGHFGIVNDFSNLKKLKTYFDWIKKANILAIDELVMLTNNFLKYST
ncbi:BLUF domain-containing protein [uncultured Lacinutrix sp.]|uniref:BLUF domain-containing protein n=1 Tax=uncultured Lacinutrix sp. TaxID=574032 RepID=UPI00260CD9DF|nr:BLUF domain-containing protein [uncultured Lacinutrix sp.]